MEVGVGVAGGDTGAGAVIAGISTAALGILMITHPSKHVIANSNTTTTPATIFVRRGLVVERATPEMKPSSSDIDFFFNFCARGPRLQTQLTIFNVQLF
jgi:hypothetical protein